MGTSITLGPLALHELRIMNYCKHIPNWANKGKMTMDISSKLNDKIALERRIAYDVIDV